MQRARLLKNPVMSFTAKPTTNILSQLRSLMKNKKHVPEVLSAYVVPSTDAHNSEYIADKDTRRAFISGFTGSNGLAVVTDKEALLWTDGRYFLQAAEQMDKNWKLMKLGVAGTPKPGRWISRNLPKGSTIGVDPTLLSVRAFKDLEKKVTPTRQKIVAVSTNLVDLIWKDRPSKSKNPVESWPYQFSGQRIRDKLALARNEMKTMDCDCLVISALDEVAWLLNIRGTDIPYNPLVFAYVIVEKNALSLFIDEGQLTEEVRKHFLEEIGSEIFNIHPYEKIFEVLKETTSKVKGNFWLSGSSSFALTSTIPRDNLVLKATPPQIMKVTKNAVEVLGMRNAHIKDAAALCCYFDWLEKNIPNGNVTEISAADQLEKYRQMQQDYKGPSFTTISSSGPHGAIIHYAPTLTSDVPLTLNDLYLCDSGGQFKDGTTDVTRTIHFGTPTKFEMECYTRVLKGQIAIGRLIFPEKITGSILDSFSRKFLWDIGLDFAHSTGHGVGAYLNVHEGPIGITKRASEDDPGLQPGMFLSNEPGYYEDGKFGIRIEDVVVTVKAETPHSFGCQNYLCFDTVTVVPKQTKLIAKELMTEDEISCLNQYHQKCRDLVGPVLEKQGLKDARAWLFKETQPI